MIFSYTSLCQHGCGQPATYTTKSSLGTGPFKGAPVNQCARSHNSCPAVKAKKVASSLEKYGTEYPWQTKEISEKRNQTNLEKYGHISSIMNPEIQAKRKSTMMERYGVEEPTMNTELRDKAAAGVKQAYINDPELSKRQLQIKREKYGEDLEDIFVRTRATQIAMGRWIDPAPRSEWEQYKKKVKYYTYKNYRKLKHIINPEGLVLGLTTYQIDHIFSQKAGFEQGIDPKIISHPGNLRILPASENQSKSSRCDITLEELMIKTKGPEGPFANPGHSPTSD